MAYVVLSQDEQDEIITAFMLTQERDHFTHTVNQNRYIALTASLPAGPFLDRIKQLQSETESRLAEVNAILADTLPQLPPLLQRDAAIARLKAKGVI